MSTKSPPAIEVTDLSLAYRLPHTKAGTFKEFMLNLLRRQVEYEKLWALQGVSFTVEPGEVLGVVGPNGAGKTTLMRTIAGVLQPTVGRVVVRGAVAPLIALGAGFNPDLTAYENIVIYGALLGRSPQTMREKAPQIAEWAGLTEFLDVPTRSFSSGMMARLAFSVATDIDATILVVDEVLSVGDAAFRKQSRKRMENLIRGGASVILVSHSLGMLRKLSDRVMWMDRGQVKMIGNPKEVVTAYESTV